MVGKQNFEKKKRVASSEVVRKYLITRSPSEVIDWRGGSAVGSTGCSPRRLEFSLSHPHGASQSSSVPVPGDPIPLQELGTHSCWVHEHA